MPKNHANNSHSMQVPKNMEPIFKAITELTDKVCRDKLDDEYAQLSRAITAALTRKYQSPLTSGKINTWACGIVYALGSVNFLFDKSFEPYLNATQLCDAFNVSKKVGGAKSKQVKDALDMYPMDPKWCLPSMIEKNSLAWLIQVDGFIIDARQASRELQEIAFKKGLIPYIPG